MPFVPPGEVLNSDANKGIASMKAKSLEELKEELPPEVYITLVSILEISSGNFDICPHCGAEIEELKQVGRSVYGSCGCRLYQGFVPQSK